MSDRNESNRSNGLNRSGLTEDEGRWLAAGGAGAIFGPYESESRFWPSFWMALGFLALVGFESVTGLCGTISYCFFTSTRIVAVFFQYAVLYGIALALAYQLASGRLEQFTERLTHRYTNRRRLVTDLLVAMALLVLSPTLLARIAIYIAPDLISDGRILPAPALIFVVYRSIPWIVCIGILAYLLPRKGKMAERLAQPSAFRLDDAVAVWRTRLLAGEGVEEEDTLELEEHLREEVGALTQGGVPESQAFAVACRRMGGQEDLCREFAKAQPEVVRRTRARWMLLGVLMMFVFRAGQKTLQILPFLNWKLGIGPSIDIRLSSSFVDIVVWACGIYLFVRFANGGFARLAQWLNQRHKTARGLSTDLAFLIVVLIAAEMLWLLALGLDRAPSFGEMTLVFLNTGVPLLLATCAGIYWLHPMKGQVRV